MKSDNHSEMIIARVIAVAGCLLFSSIYTSAQTPGLQADSLNLAERLHPAPPSAVFSEQDFYVWCGSRARGSDGKYHLLYSRWPKADDNQPEQLSYNVRIPLLPDKPKPTKQTEADWANLARYRSENTALSVPKENEQRVVFMGDSLTDYWGRREGEFFPNKPYINRGIGGQTTGQILARFTADVLQLKPKIVIILGGSNDMRLACRTRKSNII